jgi:hypothetical protein
MLPMVFSAIPPEAVMGVILLSRSARIAIGAVTVAPPEAVTRLYEEVWPAAVICIFLSPEGILAKEYVPFETVLATSLPITTLALETASKEGRSTTLPLTLILPPLPPPTPPQPKSITEQAMTRENDMRSRFVTAPV